MSIDKKIHILLIDMEYARSELNEPINIDVIIDSFDSFVIDHSEIDVWYRSMGDCEERTNKNYDLVLISSKVSSGAALEELICRFYSKPIIIGGMLATYAHEYLLKKYPEVILSLGECECNLNAIVASFIRFGNFDEVKKSFPRSGCSGVAWIDSSGKIELLPIAAYDISKTKKPLSHRTLSTIIRKNGLVRIEGSRGCPWNRCSFCSVSWKYGGANWRAFPVDRTMAEIKLLSDNGSRCIYFTDEDFVGCSDYFLSLLSEVSSLMDARRISPEIQIWGSTSVYTLSHFSDDEFKRFIALSKKCNIQVLFLGIESGCMAQLKRYNKGVSSEDNLRILKSLSENGIIVDAGFIMFDAETNLAEIRENLEFCKLSGLDKSLSRLAKPLRIIPHTNLYMSYRKQGFLKDDFDFSELIYDYRFQDEKVEMLFKSLSVFDAIVLQNANSLQAELRMSGDYTSNRIASALTEYRRIYFDFIEEFANTFSSEPLDICFSEAIIRKYTKRFLDLQ